MLGAIAGDMIGSVYEWHPVKEIFRCGAQKANLRMIPS